MALVWIAPPSLCRRVQNKWRHNYSATASCTCGRAVSAAQPDGLELGVSAEPIVSLEDAERRLRTALFDLGLGRRMSVLGFLSVIRCGPAGRINHAPPRAIGL